MTQDARLQSDHNGEKEKEKKSVCLHDLDDKKLKNTRPVRKERSLQIGKNLPPLSKISKLLGLTLCFNTMANYYNSQIWLAPPANLLTLRV